MMADPEPYNPLAKENLAASIAARLLSQESQRFPERSFRGVGLYAIYYSGQFPLYRKISEPNQNGRMVQPIYIGKAEPEGGRKGLGGLDVRPGNKLFNRLSKHATSIVAAQNLDISDFACRWLVVDEVFIRLAERLLISHYRPLWNAVVDGFGNNTPGKGRDKGKKPLWDVLHPGRIWAEKLAAPKSVNEVEDMVREFLRNYTVPSPELHT